MADRIKGITIVLDGDAGPLNKAISSVDKSLKETQRTLKDVDKLLKLDPTNTELLRQKQDLLKKAVSDTEDKLAKEKEALAKLAEKDQTPEVQKQMAALERQIVEDEAKLKSLKEQLRDFGSVAKQQLKAVGEKFKEIGNKISDVGQKLMPVSATAGAIGAGLLKMGYNAVKSADDLKTLSQQTGISVEELQKMQYASELVDVSLEDITGALRKMKPKMSEGNKTFEKLGVSVTNADGSLRDATDVFYDSIDALSKIQNETERDQVAMELFGKSADELAGIIDDGGAALKQYGQEAADAGLILSENTVNALNDTNDTIDKLKADMSGTMAEVGADVAQVLAPALEKGGEVIKTITAKLRELTPEQQATILKIVGIVAAIAPAILIIGKLVAGIGSVISVIGTIVGVLGGPLTLVIAGAVAAGILLYKNWDKIKAFAKKLYDTLKKVFANIKKTITDTWKTIKNTIQSVWSSITTTVTTAINKVKSTVESVMNAIKTVVSNVWNTIKTTVSNVTSNISSTASTAWNNIKSGASTAWNAISTTVTNVANSMKTSLSNAFNNIKTGASTAWNNIKSAITDPIGTAKTALLNNVNAIESAFKFVGINSNTVKSFFNGVRAAITDPIGTAKDTINSAVSTIKGAFNFGGISTSPITSALSAVKNAITNPISTAKDTISSAVSTIKNAFGISIDTSKIYSVFNAVKTAISGPIESAKSLVNSAVDTIKGIFPIKMGKIFSGIKLPHFIISGGQAPWGIGGAGVKPSISISWYRKAYDQPYLFTTPTIVGGRGFGDGGGSGELVYGRDALLRDIAAASSGQITVNVYASDGMNVNQLANAVQNRLVQLQRQRERAFA